MGSCNRIHSQYVYRETLDRLISPDTRWLDIGCGHTILPEWMRDSIPTQKELLSRCKFSIGCDPVDDRPHVGGLKKIVHQGRRLPFDDEAFNLVTANMVAEHIEDPASFAQEMRRVLCPGGLFVIHTPNLLYFEVLIAYLLPDRLVRSIAHHLDGRRYEDIYPTRYRMNTSKALRRLQGFRARFLDCVETAPQLQKVPVLNIAESIFIRMTRYESMRPFRADWIAVLEKLQTTTHCPITYPARQPYPDPRQSSSHESVSVHRDNPGLARE